MSHAEGKNHPPPGTCKTLTGTKAIGKVKGQSATTNPDDSSFSLLPLQHHDTTTVTSPITFSSIPHPLWSSMAAMTLRSLLLGGHFCTVGTCSNIRVHNGTPFLHTHSGSCTRFFPPRGGRSTRLGKYGVGRTCNLESSGLAVWRKRNLAYSCSVLETFRQLDESGWTILC